MAVEGERRIRAYNPPLAHAALEAEPELGVPLPCNVVVYSQDGVTHIAAIDAEQMLSIVGNGALAETAHGSSGACRGNAVGRVGLRVTRSQRLRRLRLNSLPYR